MRRGRQAEREKGKQMGRKGGSKNVLKKENWETDGEMETETDEERGKWRWRNRRQRWRDQCGEGDK